jgi:hypothetical protein
MYNPCDPNLSLNEFFHIKNSDYDHTPYWRGASKNLKIKKQGSLKNSIGRGHA